MRKMLAKTSIRVALAALAACLISACARADDITIAPLGTITVTQGQLNVAIDGTLTNNTGSPLDVLGSETVPGADPLSIVDLSPFTLSAGANGPMELFSFDVLSNAALGIELGSYDIVDALGNSYTVDFTLDVIAPVTSAPESSSLLFLATGLCSLMYFPYRRRALST